MEFTELAVRIHLGRLKVDGAADRGSAGAAHEPQYWFVIAKADATTDRERSPLPATVTVHTASGSPIMPGATNPAAGSAATFATTLRGATGATLAHHTRFATLVVAVAALDDRAGRTQDFRVLQGNVIAESKRRLHDELRDIAHELLAGYIPSLTEVRKRLDAQLDEATFTTVVDGDEDTLVGHNVDTVLTFPELLAHSIDGVPIDVALHRSDVEDRRARYRLTGVVERTDIQEPPTIGLVHLDDNRLRVCGRTVGKRAFVHERSTTGRWGDASALGTTELSSGVALAASADGSRMYAAARGLDRTMRIKVPDDDRWQVLPGPKFSTGAGIACAADGRRVYAVATAEDGNVYATGDFDDANISAGDWFPIGVRSIASPALACSADGQLLFLITLGEDRRFYESVIDAAHPELAAATTVPVDDRRFRSAPACACSADGTRQWIAGIGDDGRLRVGACEPGGARVATWSELGELISAPALTCSADGRTVHIAAIDKALRLRHRYSTDGGTSWPKRDGLSWEVLRENAAWF